MSNSLSVTRPLPTQLLDRIGFRSPAPNQKDDYPKANEGSKYRGYSSEIEGKAATF